MQTKSFLTTLTAVGLFAGLAAAQNDICSDAIDIGSGATSVPFSTIGAAAEIPPPSCGGTGGQNSDVWFSWTAANTGAHWMHTCGASYDAVLAVYDACGGNEITCSDGFSNQPPPCNNMFDDAAVLFDVIAGTTYQIRVGGWNSGVTGTGDLTIIDNSASAPPNDTCAAPEIIDGCGGVSIPFDTTTAYENTMDPGCGGAPPIDIWYSITPAASGTLELDTCGSLFDTKLAVWDTCAGPAITCNAYDDSNCGSMQPDVSRISLSVTAGVTYLIQVGGFSISTGVGVLNVGPLLIAPQNYCLAGVSGGSIGVTAASSLSVAANDFTVEATGIPDTAGLIFFGESQGADPFGAGFRCVLAGPLGTVRTMPGIASGGTASRTIDLSSGPILAGSCWNFQYWFRRNDLPELFDLTDAVTVPFAP